MKQTAVNYLFEQICSEKLSWIKDSNGKVFFDETTSIILNKAKEMEKQQIIDAANSENSVDINHGEQYYKETFKK